MPSTHFSLISLHWQYWYSTMGAQSALQVAHSAFLVEVHACKVYCPALVVQLAHSVQVDPSGPNVPAGHLVAVGASSTAWKLTL